MSESKTQKQQLQQEQLRDTREKQQASTGSVGQQTTSKQYQSGSSVSTRQNFSEESESLINQLINQIFFKCYTCTAMTYYFDREDVGLFGMADFFRWRGRESYQCCRLLMDYIVVRGGEVEFDTIKKPEKTEWGTPLEALQYLIDLNKVINQQVLKIHSQACEQVDPHLTDFLETVILRPLVEFIRKLGVMVTNLQRVGPKLGEYQFNKDVELHLQQIMRDVKLSHSQVPITAVGASVSPFIPTGIVPSYSGVPCPTGGQFGSYIGGPLNYLPGVGSTLGGGSTSNFSLSDVVHMISNVNLGVGGRRFI